MDFDQTLKQQQARRRRLLNEKFISMCNDAGICDIEQ